MRILVAIRLIVGQDKVLTKKILTAEDEIDALKAKLAIHEEKLKSVEITEKDVQDYLDSIFPSSSDEEIVRSSIIDCMINRVEVENGDKMWVLFNVIRTGVLEQIEKRPMIPRFLQS